MTRTRAGKATKILKARSHTNTRGNDEADRVAKKAAMQPHLAVHHDTTGETTHEGQH